MAVEPPELQTATTLLLAAVKAGWQPTDTDQHWLGQVVYTCGTYLNLDGEWTAGHFDVYQHGVEIESDIADIYLVVTTAFTQALAADLSPPVRTLLQLAADWEPQPHSDWTPWKQAAWSLIPDEHNPY
ncbi:hypothetical protein [Streptomyces sp. SID13031]|uniref:hypothetical protein n=1 Tax=Streptomyces sp. SID13031 TaxID=2706046 RepID=UPI0013CB5720|nr:hypothetical protein [Streptomyces sp. SID13031]NEA36762.1 hypothetical protein [Streptomyces sp. SID13031]